jgi:dTDP-4-amino-4,6-dideoxygalactose transaminase
MALLINEIKRQSEALAPELAAAVERVLRRGWYILGPEVKEFEQEFAAYCRSGRCVSVANGTEALEIALRALELPPGSKVANVANAGMYATTAILHAGLRPLYVDVDRTTLTMDAGALSAAIDAETSAVIVTHLYGQMADMPAISEIAKRSNLPLIEDCAQAHGAELQGVRAGAWGKLGCFSFYPTKNLGALGDGGAIVTGDEKLAERCRLLRQYGWSEKYRCSIPGGRNSRLDEMQAAVLLAKLPHLEEWNRRRRTIAQRYNEAFAGLEVQVPCGEGPDYVAHLYVVRTRQRERVQASLKEAGIASDVHYPVPDYLQEGMRSVPGNTAVHLPVTEECCKQVLTLPCFPELTEQEQRVVIDRVRSALRAGGEAKLAAHSSTRREQQSRCGSE